jgi:hypothetical protein
VWAFELAQQVFERMPAMKVAHGLLWSVDQYIRETFLDEVARRTFYNIPMKNAVPGIQ